MRRYILTDKDECAGRQGQKGARKRLKDSVQIQGDDGSGDRPREAPRETGGGGEIRARHQKAHQHKRRALHSLENQILNH